uniref:Uncharacterized protein n=1 Tax=Setaria viridis TaxID=4556 RepID=A0A4U6VTI8_SETVI|nr:hypothetical protein SEVIR_2G182700v2 [Setaria viridis]TKW32662.1 hypothetical protein SEVIR_2G182700v2 [Setaria viridis]TKW32666.1 hypothetical protein SEVIR_2G182700v2 [Setaria viridis]
MSVLYNQQPTEGYPKVVDWLVGDRRTWNLKSGASTLCNTRRLFPLTFRPVFDLLGSCRHRWRRKQNFPSHPGQASKPALLKHAIVLHAACVAWSWRPRPRVPLHDLAPTGPCFTRSRNGGIIPPRDRGFLPPHDDLSRCAYPIPFHLLPASAHGGRRRSRPARHGGRCRREDALWQFRIPPLLLSPDNLLLAPPRLRPGPTRSLMASSIQQAAGKERADSRGGRNPESLPAARAVAGPDVGGEVSREECRCWTPRR